MCLLYVHQDKCIAPWYFIWHIMHTFKIVLATQFSKFAVKVFFAAIYGMVHNSMLNKELS